MIGGWGEEGTGDYRRDFCRNLCRRISVQQSCDNAQCCVTCRAQLERSMLWKRVQKRIEALAEASVAVATPSYAAQALQSFLSCMKRRFICLQNDR